MTHVGFEIRPLGNAYEVVRYWGGDISCAYGEKQEDVFDTIAEAKEFVSKRSEIYFKNS